MSISALLPVMVVLSSAAPSLLIFFLGDERLRLRRALYLGGEVALLALVLLMLRGIYLGGSYEARMPLLPGIDFVLRANALAMLFLVLSAGLWFLTTLYSIGYLGDDPHRARFYGFFGLCVTSTTGVALAGNLFTFFIFYEMLTLATYPLVIHRDTPEAIAAGRKYLAYTLIGGQVLLAGMVALQIIEGPLEFAAGGAISGEASRGVLILIFALLIAGLGVKAALVPLHSWLPSAMVAPTPVSALLHGVAVVKTGAFGILRVVYEVYGIELCRDLGVLLPLSLVASFTIIYGSLRALGQDEMKGMLAYSTVSQVSYIVLGASLLGFMDTVGALAHLVHQGIMKVTLFFCAGVVAETLGIYNISKMDGVARRLPWTMAAFSVAAFGMIGLPPMAGFLSKWFLGVGAVEAGQPWAVAVLVGSTVLNAAYFLPVVYRAWFRSPQGEWKEKRPKTRFEADWLLLFPTLALAPVAPLPALWLALFAGTSSRVEVPWLLLGAEFGLTTTTRVFLVFTALLWAIAGFYARSYMRGDEKEGRFFAFYLVTMTGNLGLILARDLASFYLFFTLMSLTAYGLVIHEGTEKARYAARAYLILAILGEAFVLPAVILPAATATTDLDVLAAGVATAPLRDVIIALALVGFGVKAGALGLHVWLPLAHPAAPTPASAVLSGTMIKAGLLGWMLFLPLGEAESAGWGALLLVAGILAAFYGIALGLTQERPKTILAYSSISQMGYMTVAVGAGLFAPEAWVVALTAILVYATHHALAKGALFLGVGVVAKTDGARRWRRLPVVAGLLLASLAIAAAPLTSGAVAKEYLKDAAGLTPYYGTLSTLLDVATVGSALLMARFLIFVWPRAGDGEKGPEAGLWAPWALSVGGVATFVLFLPIPIPELAGILLTFSSLWPVTVGVALATGAWLLNRRSGGKLRCGLEPRVPEGDLVVPMSGLLGLARDAWMDHVSPIRKGLAERLASLANRCRAGLRKLRVGASELESRARYWTVAGSLFVLLVAALFVLSALT